MTPVRYGVIGAGWRAEFFIRAAVALPRHVQLVGVLARRPDAADRLRREFGADPVATVDELLGRRSQFVVSSVSKQASPDIVTALVERGVPVLAETPPAPDLDSLRALWCEVGAGGLVQVAEQYLSMPGHAARLELVGRGVIGQPTSVQVSSTHGYHAVAMIRGLLGGGFHPATVSARRFCAPLVDPVTREGWTDDAVPRPAATTIATIDFADRAGLYDFTDNQWHNPLRTRRILVRGSHGELADDDVTRLVAPRTIVTSSMVRRQAGYDLDLTGDDSEQISFDGTVLWRNDLFGLRLADEELAIASMLARTASWVRGNGPPPYPLAEACEDQLIALAIDEAVSSGGDVRTGREAWAAHSAGDGLLR